MSSALVGVIVARWKRAMTAHRRTLRPSDCKRRVSFPIEVRVLAADEVPLSMASGRASAFIAVHVYWKQQYERYFREVEAIMDGFEGRPHWGKLHFQTAERLRRRYPLWDGFVAVRDRLDPERVFGNAYLERVLGP